MVKLRKIGNSLGLILPKKILEAAGISSNDELEVVVRSGELRIKKVKTGVCVTLTEKEAKALVSGENLNRERQAALTKVRKALD